MQGHPGTGDRGRARAAVRLDDVAIDADLPLAHALQVHHRSQRAPDQPLDLLRAAGRLAACHLAARALMGGARQHAVLGRDPAAPLAAQPARHAGLQAGRAQHVGVAEAHQAGPFRVPRDAAFEGDPPHLVGRAA